MNQLAGQGLQGEAEPNSGLLAGRAPGEGVPGQGRRGAASEHLPRAGAVPPAHLVLAPAQGQPLR